MSHRRTLIVVALLSFAGGLLGALQAGTTRREPQFENRHVKVWKSVIMPDQPLTFHRHDHGRVLIALTNGHLKVIDPNQKEIGEYRWQAGKAYWLGADPPGQTHADVNVTKDPVEVIVVELQQDR